MKKPYILHPKSQTHKLKKETLEKDQLLRIKNLEKMTTITIITGVEVFLNPYYKIGKNG